MKEATIVDTNDRSQFVDERSIDFVSTNSQIAFDDTQETVSVLLILIEFGLKLLLQ